jgi:hypothetical protein
VYAGGSADIRIDDTASSLSNAAAAGTGAQPTAIAVKIATDATHYEVSINGGAYSADALIPAPGSVVLTGAAAGITLNFGSGTFILGDIYSWAWTAGSAALAAGGASNCQVEVTYTAASAGQYTANLVVTDANSVSDSVTLTGGAVNNNGLTISPNGSQAVGNAAAGNASAGTTFTVTNPAGAATTGPLEFSFGSTATSYVNGTNFAVVLAGGTCHFDTSTVNLVPSSGPTNQSTTLAGGASCTVVVDMNTLASVGAGAHTDTFAVADLANGSNTIGVTVTGTTTAALTLAAATGSSITFPSTTTCTASVAETYTLTNHSLTATTALDTSLAGNLADFTVDSDACEGTTLAAGGTCNINVIFNPEHSPCSTALGSVSTTLAVTPASGIAAASLTLTGTGT